MSIKFFLILYSIYRLEKDKIVDGVFSSFSGKGLVHITHSLSLSSVLHVPSFVSMDVIFFESQPYFSSSLIPLHGKIQDKVVSREDEIEKEIWGSSIIIKPKVSETKSVPANGKVELEKKYK